MSLGFILWLAMSVLPQPLADQTCLATTIYLEARGEPTDGQFAVAEVALRRQEGSAGKRDVCQIVTAPWQFAPATTPKSFTLRDQPAWDKAWRIAGEAMHMWQLPAEQRVVVVPDANHFVRLDMASPAWAKGDPVRTIGEHSFYAID